MVVSEQLYLVSLCEYKLNLVEVAVQHNTRLLGLLDLLQQRAVVRSVGCRVRLQLQWNQVSTCDQPYCVEYLSQRDRHPVKLLWQFYQLLRCAVQNSEGAE